MNMSDDRIAEDIMRKAQQARKLARYMSSTQELVERKILKAQEEGEFDNLPGSGKPVALDENPFEPLEMRMAYKILKDSGYAPYWIELGKEIDDDFLRLEADVETFKKYVRIHNRNKHNKLAWQRFEHRCKRFYDESRQQLEKIHNKIIDFNLICPVFNVHRANITIETEMERIKTVVQVVIENG